MKKRIMLSIGVLAIAVVVSLNINLAKTDLSSLAFMNIQALAGETGGGEPGGGETAPDLSKGCATEVATSYDSETKTRIRTKKCVKGSASECKKGEETYVNGVKQAGSAITAYTCKSYKP